MHSLLKLSYTLICCPKRLTATVTINSSIGNSCFLVSGGHFVMYSPAFVNTPVNVAVAAISGSGTATVLLG